MKPTIDVSNKFVNISLCFPQPNRISYRILKYLCPISSPTDATSNLFISTFTCSEERKTKIYDLLTLYLRLPSHMTQWKRTNRSLVMSSQFHFDFFHPLMKGINERMHEKSFKGVSF